MRCKIRPCAFDQAIRPFRPLPSRSPRSLQVVPPGRSRVSFARFNSGHAKSMSACNRRRRHCPCVILPGVASESGHKKGLPINESNAPLIVNLHREQTAARKAGHYVYHDDAAGKTRPAPPASRARHNEKDETVRMHLHRPHAPPPSPPPGTPPAAARESIDSGRSRPTIFKRSQQGLQVLQELRVFAPDKAAHKSRAMPGGIASPAARFPPANSPARRSDPGALFRVGL